MRCLMAPVLAFADFKKPFLLETDASIEGLGTILSQKQDDNRYHPVAYTSWFLKGGELKYHSSKLEFLALKWAITDQFKEYLQYQPFLVKTNNNPLIYVLLTPNLDAISHRWVAAVAGYNFKIEYMRSGNNKVADTLSRVGGRLNEDVVKEILSHPTHFDIPRAEANDPSVAEEHDKTEGEVIMQAHMLADSHWVMAQCGDMAIRLVIEWLKRRKDDHCTLDQYLKHHIPDTE